MIPIRGPRAVFEIKNQESRIKNQESRIMNHESDGLVRDADGVTRCWWPGGDPLYVRYHDQEWGTPVTDDCRLFEKICLEGFQAGLSWLTILRKRENFRRAFADFVPEA